MPGLIKYSRSRKGAWIEMLAGRLTGLPCKVAPVRERGLKFKFLDCFASGKNVAPVRERGLKLQEGRKNQGIPGRSRKGAWIEMAFHAKTSASQARSLP